MCSLLFVAVLAGPLLAAADAPPDAKAILTTRGLWRVRIVWENDEILLKDGSIAHARLKYDSKPWWKNVPTIEQFTVVRTPLVRLPADTPAEWMRPEFDDSAWVRTRGPLFGGDPADLKGGWGSRNVHWKLLLLRGRFEVADPAKAGDLTLSLVFRGGAVVYLNGEPLARSHMPDGPLDLYTNADAYPPEVYVSPKGHLISSFDTRLPGCTQRLRRRWRRLTDLRIPAAKLRRGVNVLAVAVHRAPADWRFYTTRVRPFAYGAYDERNAAMWCRAALWKVELQAPADAAVVPNCSRPDGKGFLAWNQSILRRVWAMDYADPHETLRPVRIAGARNGEFAGQLVAGLDAPIEGLTAEVSDLKGPGVIPASAVRLRYAVADGERREWRYVSPSWFDSLDDAPAAKIPVRPEHGGAIQPIWLAVRIPADAKPGDYEGTITLRARGRRVIRTPLQVRIIDWTLPDRKRFTPDVDIIQSPESVAMAYDVPFWSEKHWALLDRGFELLGGLGVKTLYVTCIRRTHFGNEHAMVRWVRDADGVLQPDLSVAERYVDLAVRRLGRIPGVILYVWEPPNSMGHAGSGPSRTHDRDILISVVDPDTGELHKQKGPRWGTAECRAFWKRLTDAMSRLLRRYGVADSMMFGLLGDHRATKRAMDDLVAGSPNTRWALHSHNYCDHWLGHDIRMCIALWGVKCYPADPEKGHGYGYLNPFWLGYYPREMHMGSPVVEHRIKIENHLGSIPWNLSRWPKSMGIRGIGRLGADFWRVIKDKAGNPRATLAARYPETYWGQLCLNYGVPALFGRGRTGPVPTVRSEGFRENLQEIEARIFIERALADKAQRARIGDELAARCRRALDTRIRAALRSAGEGWVWFVSSGWEKRTEHLFDLAAEVGARLGAPSP
jgi:hypothetical protein